MCDRFFWEGEGFLSVWAKWFPHRAYPVSGVSGLRRRVAAAPVVHGRPAGGRLSRSGRWPAVGNRPVPAGQRHGGCRESDAGTGPAGVQQVALTAAFRSSSVNSRCFFVPGARSLLRTSAPRLVRDGEPDTRRLSRCACSAWATLSAWPSRLRSITTPWSISESLSYGT